MERALIRSQFFVCVLLLSKLMHGQEPVMSTDAPISLCDLFASPGNFDRGASYDLNAQGRSPADIRGCLASHHMEA